MIKERGSGLVPEMRFADLASGRGSEEFGTELKKRGVAVVRGVVSEEEALGWKEEVREYVRANPQTRGRLSICDVFEVAMCFGRRNNVFICLLPVDTSFLSLNAMSFDSPLMLTSPPTRTHKSQHHFDIHQLYIHSPFSHPRTTTFNK